MKKPTIYVTDDKLAETEFVQELIRKKYKVVQLRLKPDAIFFGPNCSWMDKHITVKELELALQWIKRRMGGEDE